MLQSDAQHAVAVKVGKALKAYRARNGQYPISIEEWFKDEPDLDKRELAGWTYYVFPDGNIEVSRGDYDYDGWHVWWNSDHGAWINR